MKQKALQKLLSEYGDYFDKFDMYSINIEGVRNVGGKIFFDFRIYYHKTTPEDIVITLTDGCS